ncbi:transposase-like protein [Pseudomonas sp. BAY1663]|uniref:Transposase n=1 Tax=Stutzerimonas stutzeri TaxID=316 RepID=A0A2N8T7J7_STUST|nr:MULTISPECIES: transposase [Pseudomonadaceae]EXF42498.1 transposase-like protein [Pseudomonas sp. BAY1663]MCQ4327683.1 transposase [Stutzerimonas stutzeri]PNG10734.1 transposase [Stutzerimonas stutzeri]
MGTETHPTSNRLRLGRWSAVEQIYLITTVTRHRAKVFEEFSAARMLIHTMQEDARRGSHLTLAFVVMPDHLHWLVQLRQGALSGLVGRVKSISAKRLGRKIWQDGFHDHALRHEEDLVTVARYVVANPLRAGLVRRIGDYPHWDAVWL